MLNIEAQVFRKNLLVTQQYCLMQMKDVVVDDRLIDTVSVLRSFNPEINEKEIFEFGIEEYREYSKRKIQLVKSVRWTQQPNETGSNSIIDGLFRDQLAYKEKCLEEKQFLIRDIGDIVIVAIDHSLLDGASATASCYLFDDFDLPPIDTWFYLLDTNETRLLFAWIPDEYLKYVEDAIAVNCVDCIGWFKKLYEPEYKRFYGWNILQ